VNALREIRHYQKQAGTIFPQAAFMRLVRELLHELSNKVTHVSASGHACLQHATEAYIVTFFELMYHILITRLNDFSNRAAIHAGRQTIFVKDSVFIRDIMRIVDPSSTLARQPPSKNKSNNLLLLNVGPSMPTTGGKAPRKSLLPPANKGGVVTKHIAAKKPITKPSSMGLPPAALAKRTQNRL
jgi:histone H3/H4